MVFVFNNCCNFSMNDFETLTGTKYCSPQYLLNLIPYENAESKLQFDLIYIQFYRCLPPENISHLRQNAAFCGWLFGSTHICEQTFSITKLNKSIQRNQLINANLNALVKVATINITPLLCFRLSYYNILNYFECEYFFFCFYI